MGAVLNKNFSGCPQKRETRSLGHTAAVMQRREDLASELQSPEGTILMVIPISTAVGLKRNLNPMHVPSKASG